MSGLCGYINFVSKYDNDIFSSSINLNEKEKILNFHFEEASFLISENKNKIQNYYFDEDLLCAFHGEIISENISWKKIIDKFKNSDYKYFESMSGDFNFIFFEKQKYKLTIINDNRSQDPLFYFNDKNKFLFSTELSTCSRFGFNEINTEWIKEYIYFNYSISYITPILDVRELITQVYYHLIKIILTLNFILV